MLRRCPSAGRAAPLPAGAPAATPAAGLPSSSQRRPPRHLPSPPSKAASPAASCATGSCSLPARRSVRRPGTPLQAPLQAVPVEPGLECLVPPLPVRPHAIGAPSRRLFPSTTDAGVLEPPWRPVPLLGVVLGVVRATAPPSSRQATTGLLPLARAPPPIGSKRTSSRPLPRAGDLGPALVTLCPPSTYCSNTRQSTPSSWLALAGPPGSLYAQCSPGGLAA